MESLDRHWRVGVRSAEIITRKLSRGMARRNACMIFVLSSATLAPVKGLGGYTVAKFGLLGLAHVLLKEHGPHLRVACLSPSLMDTPMLQDLSEMARTMMLEGTSGKRFVPTDFLAQQILDLYETGDSTPELRNLLIE
jgi:NAD(P)-dependent dehydrogenase (short-subunit alcohol dehydrogenase family)